MNREEILLRNYRNVHNSLLQAAAKAGRQPDEITLVAVTKYAQDADVLFLLEKGLLHHIAESRVQQALTRWQNPLFAKYNTCKHFIGHLQKNKAAKAAVLFDFIDSLDSAEIAHALEKHIPDGKTLRGLVQVKLTDRATQTGLPLPQARLLVKELKSLTRLRICGYMGIAPQGADESTLRTLFGQVQEAFEQDFPSDAERYLSLGMSEDFTTAVEMGSTMPRIGSKLFATDLEEV